MASKKELEKKKKVQALKEAEQKAVKFIPKTSLDNYEAKQPKRNFTQQEVEKDMKYAKQLKKRGIKLNGKDPVYSMGNLNYQTRKRK